MKLSQLLSKLDQFDTAMKGADPEIVLYNPDSDKQEPVTGFLIDTNKNTIELLVK